MGVFWVKLRNSPYQELVQRYQRKNMGLFESVLKEVIDQEWETRISLAKGNKPRGTGYSTKDLFIEAHTERLQKNAQVLIDLMDYSSKERTLP